MSGKEIIDITRQNLEKKESISEEVAHQLISSREKVLMVFERPDQTLYGYEATEFTDLGHAKKQTINELVGFFKL